MGLKGEIARRWSNVGDRAFILSVAAGSAVIVCGLYCVYLWPKPPVPNPLEPDISLTCWLFCGVTLKSWAALLNILSGAALIAGGLAVKKGDSSVGISLSIIFGLLTLPVGALPLYGAWALKRSVRRAGGPLRA